MENKYFTIIEADNWEDYGREIDINIGDFESLKNFYKKYADGCYIECYENIDNIIKADEKNNESCMFDDFEWENYKDAYIVEDKKIENCEFYYSLRTRGINDAAHGIEDSIDSFIRFSTDAEWEWDGDARNFAGYELRFWKNGKNVFDAKKNKKIMSLLRDIVNIPECEDGSEEEKEACKKCDAIYAEITSIVMKAIKKEYGDF